MKNIIQFVQTYEVYFMWGSCLGFCVLVLVCLCVLIRKISRLQKKMNGIVGQVEEYLKAVYEDSEEAIEEEDKRQEQLRESLRLKEEEANNQVISSVLQEIFS